MVTVGEIEREIAQQKHQDPAFAQQLTVWLDQILALYSDRVLAIDLPTARRWGRLTAEVGHSSADLLIAATALEHGLTVVTCNVRHFEPTGVPMLNPIEWNIWLYNSTFQQRYICTYRQDMVEYGSS